MRAYERADLTAFGRKVRESSGRYNSYSRQLRAFDELGDVLDEVLADDDLLKDILLFHAVDEELKADDLHCTGRTEMVNGRDTRTVCRDGDIFQKGAGNLRRDRPRIIHADVEACNGVIHAVDEVLLPGSVRAQCSSIGKSIVLRNDS